MSNWQPIETAPKDGTCVLIWDGGPNIAYWVSESPFQQLSGWSTGTSDMYPEWDYELWTEPTHWMPLPDSP